MINFLHTFNPSPIIAQIGPLAFRWYGLLMVLGILAGLFVAGRLAERYQLAKREELYDLAFYVILGGLLGARIYAVCLELPFYLAHPVEIIAVWHGGLAIHGGIIGGVLALYFSSRKKSQSLIVLTDILAPALALGQAIGRWGNYFNQELFGLPTTLPWGIPIATNNRPVDYIGYDFFHPTFLYESVLNVVNFFILFVLFRYAYRKMENLPTGQAGGVGRMENVGLVTSVYLFNYGLIRLLMEYFRIDHTPELSGVRWPVIVSFGLIILGVIGLVRVIKLRTKS